MSEGPRWLPVLILFALLGLAYLGMWRGWRRRGRKHDLPPLVEAPAVADLPTPTLEAGARYFGTTTSGDWLDRVVARGLGARSSCRLSLSPRASTSYAWPARSGSRPRRCAGPGTTGASPARSCRRTACWWSPGSTASTCSTPASASPTPSCQR